MPTRELPHIYLDTNVILDAIWNRGQGEHSREVTERIRTYGWQCSTSPFALMEMLDASHEARYVDHRMTEGLIMSEVQRTLGRRRQLGYWLSRQELAEIYSGVVHALDDQYPFITLQRPDTQGFWIDAELINGYSELGATDSIHLATALGTPCDVLVTRDRDFVAIATRNMPQAYRMPTVLPEALDAGLREAGFKVDASGRATRIV